MSHEQEQLLEDMLDVEQEEYKSPFILHVADSKKLLRHEKFTMEDGTVIRQGLNYWDEICDSKDESHLKALFSKEQHFRNCVLHAVPNMARIEDVPVLVSWAWVMNGKAGVEAIIDFYTECCLAEKNAHEDCYHDYNYVPQTSGYG